MPFNSYVFTLFFLPVSVVGYHILNKTKPVLGKICIIFLGSVFYIYGAGQYFFLLCFSIFANLTAAIAIKKQKHCKAILAVILIINIGLLFFYKYWGFTINIVNTVFNVDFNFGELLLPLGISFYTFQQISYVLSVYRGEIDTVNIIDYLTYTLYFPKLVMGPIMEPTSFIQQINDNEFQTVQWDNIASGIKLFSYGLFKKVILADTFSKAVAWGFNNLDTATAGDLLLVMLFYSFEIYFDFGGYSDMAIGISRMMNINLPINFNSPYRSLSIREFWRRWHISLTHFLKRNVYIPMGGNRKGKIRTYINIIIVFLISGLWHGANWTFIAWGGIYGLFNIVERIADKITLKLFDVIKWSYTFLIVSILWLLFRSDSINQWLQIIKKIFTFQNMAISDDLLRVFILPESAFFLDIFKLWRVYTADRGFSLLVFCIIGFAICLLPENNYTNDRKVSIFNMFLSVGVFVWSLLGLGSESVFVYYNF